MGIFFFQNLKERQLRLKSLQAQWRLLKDTVLDVLKNTYHLLNKDLRKLRRNMARVREAFRKPFYPDEENEKNHKL